MAIYMDIPRDIRGEFKNYRKSSHVMSDLIGEAGTKELITFGEGIGLWEKWLQKRGDPQEHFDLFDSRVDRAIAAGATVVSGRDLIAKCVGPKREVWKSGGVVVVGERVTG